MVPAPASTWDRWRHVVKLDPGRPWNDSLLRSVVESGTDAVILGGTQDIRAEAVRSLLRDLKEIKPRVPLWIEVSSEACLVPGGQGYLVPVVLNSALRRFIVGDHVRVLGAVGSLADVVRPVPEFYLVLNPDSAVARKTRSLCPLSPQEVAAYVRAARLLFGARLVYLEGSGRYFGPGCLRAARGASGDARLFYGGGIDSATRAREAGSVADTVVVGNLIYENIQRLKETVEAVRI